MQRVLCLDISLKSSFQECTFSENTIGTSSLLQTEDFKKVPRELKFFPKKELYPAGSSWNNRRPSDLTGQFYFPNAPPDHHSAFKIRSQDASVFVVTSRGLSRLAVFSRKK